MSLYNFVWTWTIIYLSQGEPVLIFSYVITSFFPQIFSQEGAVYFFPPTFELRICVTNIIQRNFWGPLSKKLNWIYIRAVLVTLYPWHNNQTINMYNFWSTKYIQIKKYIWIWCLHVTLHYFKMRLSYINLKR